MPRAQHDFETIRTLVTDGELFFEDVEIGATHTTSPHRITEADLTTFATLTHDQTPLHTDTTYCSHTVYQKPIVHGLLSLALMEGLKSELELFTHTNLASLTWSDVHFKVPVYAGDEVSVSTSFTHKGATLDPDVGIVTEKVSLQREGVFVVSGIHQLLVLRRESANPVSD